MIPWVVIDRRYLRQSRHSCALPRLFLFNIPTCKPSNIPTFGFPYALPSSVTGKSFPCHSYENCRGVYQQFPFWNACAPSEAEGPSSLAAVLKFFLFKSLRTLLLFFVPSKNSTYLFSNASALFAKNHPGWGEEAHASAHLNWLSFTSSDKISSPPAPRAQTHPAR